MVEFVSKFQDFLLKCARVWAVMRKPTKDELKITAQAAGLGMLIVGLLGFLVSVAVRLLTVGRIF